MHEQAREGLRMGPCGFIRRANAHCVSTAVKAEHEQLFNLSGEETQYIPRLDDAVIFET